MDAVEVPRIYQAQGEKASPSWCQAFAEGCGGTITQSQTIKDGPVALFGSLQLRRVLEAAMAEGRTWYYGDKAYFGRDVYYRVTKNAYQYTDFKLNATPHRFERTGMRIKPWRKSGKKILICPQSELFHEWHNIPQAQWIKAVETELAKHTKKQTQLRFKVWSRAEQDFELALEGVHAVVVFTSIAGVQATLHGVPCFATHDCESARFGSMDLSRIEDPVRPDNREQMALELADNQWTLLEMRSGMAWEHLNK